MTSQLRDAIRTQALALGFDAVGFARAELSTEAASGLRGFLTQGCHGDMGWLEAKADRRANPKVLWPEARSVVVLGLNYGPDTNPLADSPDPETGNISVYARNRDYHDTVKKRLKALGRWMAEQYKCGIKVFVDTAPVMEKPLAQAAGVGWQGKHTNLVSRSLGSWLFLGEIFTTLDLGEDQPEQDHCGDCHRCLDICPTRAFPAPYRLDARRCISYLTIEHQGPIPHELRPLIGNRIYGCDDCLAVCPWNKFARAASVADLLPRPDLRAPKLSELAALDDAAFRQLFSGSAIKRLGRDRFVRNVLIAIGNSGRAELADAAIARLSDPAPLVRGAAIWALGKIVPLPRLQHLAEAYAASEPLDDVRNEWQIALGSIESSDVTSAR